jgi:quercetin dioxygenase-like cupin family protein
MGLPRREFLYLSALASVLAAVPRTVLAQVQQATAKFSEILRQDLERQDQHVQETIAIAADFGPGTASSWHMHPGAQELFFVSDGRVTLEVEGREPRVINAGEAGIIPADTAHLVRNESTSLGAKGLVVFSRGAKDKPLLVVLKR